MNYYLKVALRLVLLGLILAGARYWFFPGDIPHPHGVLARADPVQGAVGPVALPSVAGYNLSALATYRIGARVLHTKRYYSNAADLAPIDVALGWGPMSDTAILSKLTISQTNRFFFYEWWQSPPIPKEEINGHSSNNHLIAANAQVARFIRSLRPGHLIDLHGYLVEASKHGFCWRSSLSRTDTGNGACELFYVTEAQMIEPDRPPARESTANPSPVALASDLTHSSPEAWFQTLQQQRRTLDLRDPKAVHAFNEEVRRYTSSLPVRTGSASTALTK